MTLAEIGQSYERYVGYLYESAGWEVVYRGICRGLADRGRDLICAKGPTVHVVQCKGWRADALLDHKHVEKLAQTTDVYRRAIQPDGQLWFSLPIVRSLSVQAVLVTSASLDEQAKECARLRNVIVREKRQLAIHPQVKCNRSDRHLEPLFYLPPHYAYDTVRMRVAQGDCFVFTRQEALSRGFHPASEELPPAFSRVRSTSTSDKFEGLRSSQGELEAVSNELALLLREHPPVLEQPVTDPDPLSQS